MSWGLISRIFTSSQTPNADVASEKLSLEIFGMHDAQIQEATRALFRNDGAEVELCRLYINILTNKDHSPAEKTKIFLILSNENFHASVALILLKNHPMFFGRLMFHTDVNGQKPILQRIRQELPYDWMNLYLNEIEALLEDANLVNGNEIAMHMIHAVDDKNSLFTLAIQNSRLKSMGFLISSFQENGWNETLQHFFEKNNDPKILAQLFEGLHDGWKDNAKTPAPTLVFFFTHVKFQEWVRRDFLETFTQYSPVLQSLALRAVDSPTRVLFLQKHAGRGSDLADWLEDCLSFPGNIDCKLSYCKEFAGVLAGEPLMQFVKRLISFKKCVSVPYLLAALPLDTLRKFLDIPPDNRKQLLDAASFFLLNQRELDSIRTLLQKDRTKLDLLCNATEVEIEMYLDEHSTVVQSITVLEAAGNGNALLAQQETSSIGEIQVDGFMRELPCAFFSLGACASHLYVERAALPKIYMSFLPLLNNRQFKSYICCLPPNKPAEVIAQLEKHYPVFGVDKLLALFKYLHPKILVEILSKYDAFLQAKLKPFNIECEKFNALSEKLKKTENVPGNREYAKAHLELLNQMRIVLAQSRDVVNVFSDALKKFDAHCDATIVARDRPKLLKPIMVSLSQFDHWLKSLTNEQTGWGKFLRENQPVQNKRKVADEKFDFGVESLRGVSQKEAERLGFPTIQSFEAVGIRSAADLNRLGINAKNPHLHLERLKSYLAQDNIRGLWDQMKAKQIYTLDQLCEVFLIEDSEPLSELSAIAEKL